ncbi:DUF6869 domain-containing protein [Roseobacter sp. CCS2]|uniref:DUF6869 domain-containing protein n=1 Tax=Roseobacter sp. CCS2 TaxID=391593 RepID=UPI0000F3E007|nr:hypothetical protein [Roseobacter sp. CCS2]EBA11928.1 hypothetical protein RCCS2_11564 [Roseobacter sp. CCS2]
MDYKNYSASDFESAWLKYRRSVVGSSDWLACEWVIGAAIKWSISRPHELFKAILGIARQELTLDETEMLGVGPLETLMNESFEEFVDLVFNEAARSDLVADAVNCIYVPNEFEKEFERRLALLNAN